MKLYNKILSALAMGSMVLASCTDLDTFPQSGSFTEEQKQRLVSKLSDRCFCFDFAWLVTLKLLTSFLNNHFPY